MSLRTAVRSAHLAAILGVALPALAVGTFVAGCVVALFRPRPPRRPWFKAPPPARCACGRFELGSNITRISIGTPNVVDVHMIGGCEFGVDLDGLD